MTKTHALIAIGVEMAAGRIMTDDGYPSWDVISSMVHNSDSLPEGRARTDGRTGGSACSTGTRNADVARLA